MSWYDYERRFLKTQCSSLRFVYCCREQSWLGSSDNILAWLLHCLVTIIRPTSSPNVKTRGSMISPMTSHYRRLVLAECVIGCACVSDAARRDTGMLDREGGSRLPLPALHRLPGIIVVERYRRLWCCSNAAVTLWHLPLMPPDAWRFGD